MKAPIRVFVYGTLKEGGPNHQVLSETGGSYKFVGKGTTGVKFPLVIATKYNIPFLLADHGNGNNIQGEVYEVDDEKMVFLDELEAYPKLYDREIVPINLASGGSTEAWVYMLRKWKDDFLEKATPMMDNYDSSGSHGRPYVAKYVDAKEMKDDASYDLYFETQGVKAASS